MPWLSIKIFFAKDVTFGVRLAEDFWEPQDKVSSEENFSLTAPFTEEEIKEAVFGSYAEGAPGPDGLPFLFYRNFWDLIKEDLLALFQDFHKGDLDLYRLNCALITLIPKVEEATNMKPFRPISLLNCSFKIFSNLMTNRLCPVVQRIVNKSQSDFIKGRYILESVVVAHEIVHSIHKSGEPGVVIKLDYQKVVRVSWEFLFSMLQARNYDPIWISWVRQLVVGGSVGVMVNGEDSSYFKPRKGLRQGDPISPFLFNLVGDGLAKMLDKASRAGLVKGLLSEFREGGIATLQYADDTILFSQADEVSPKNLKVVLMWYEQVSGMRINFHKSEMVPLNLG